MKKLSAILIAIFLIAGCKSGGGTSGGAGGLGTFTTESGLILSASVTADGSISVDVIQSICDVDPVSGEVTVEPGITTVTGTFTVTVQDVSDLTSGLFARGITLDRYTVTYQSQSGGSAPQISPVTQAQTISLLSGNASGTVSVVLAALGTAIEQFAQQYGGGGVFSYIVTVTYTGRDFNNEPLTLVASTFLEFGDFDRCSGS